MTIYCCNCAADVDARLTDGAETYPHRNDLHDLPFWKCDACGGFVGCHHKSSDRTRPLGCIPTPRMKVLRRQIHAIIDPLWRDGVANRGEVYALISDRFGREYHTADTRSEAEAERALDIAREVRLLCLTTDEATP